MALTQAQWFEKLKSWVPTWVFESERKNVAIFQGYAKVFAETHQILDEFVAETFILQSDGAFLDMHGSDREVDRLPNELDLTYAPRVQQIVNSANYPAIKRLVDALLVVGESTIIEHEEGSVFMNRETYYNRAAIFSDIFYDTFSIVIPRQIHEPFSFESREDFLSRETYEGTNESSLELFKQIVETVNNAKAFGTLYRLVETND